MKYIFTSKGRKVRKLIEMAILHFFFFAVVSFVSCCSHNSCADKSKEREKEKKNLSVLTQRSCSLPTLKTGKTPPRKRNGFITNDFCTQLNIDRLISNLKFILKFCSLRTMHLFLTSQGLHYSYGSMIFL